MTEMQSEGWTQAIQLMVRVYGAQRFHDGFTKALSECDFINKVADVESRIAPSIEPGEEAAKYLTHADPACQACHGSGWTMVYQGRTKAYNLIDPKLGAARRCECFRHNKAFGLSNEKSRGYVPTEGDLKFRGSDEQKRLWRDLMKRVDAFANKKFGPSTRRERPILPSCEEIAQGLEKTRQLREKLSHE